MRCFFCANAIKEGEEKRQVGDNKYVHAQLCFEAYKKYLREITEKLSGRKKGETF